MNEKPGMDPKALRNGCLIAIPGWVIIIAVVLKACGAI